VITGLVIGVISGEIGKRLKAALEASGKRGEIIK
jgi:hypothetical protein